MRSVRCRDSIIKMVMAHKNASLGSSGYAVKSMLSAAADYADNYERMYEQPLSSDYVLGPLWEDLLWSVRGLLDGETGGLDCGYACQCIVEMLEHQGFDPDIQGKKWRASKNDD